jgi:hypothetical protein
MKGILCGSALLLLVSTTAVAQTPNVSLIPFGGFNVDAEELFLGGGVGLPVPAATIGGHPLIIQPSFEFYPFLDNASLWALMAHVVIPFPIQGGAGVVPYAMGGFAIARASVNVGTPGGEFSTSNTEPFLDFGGGLAFGRSVFRTHAFAEIEARVGDGSAVLFKGGVRIATKK